MLKKEEILFPYDEIRPTQEILLAKALETIKKKKHLLAHAPTGIGKTTIIAPTLKYAIDNKKTIFFITPRHTQHHIAIETLKLIKNKYKTRFLAADFIGKKWMCPVAGTDLLSSSEFGEYCKEVREKGTCEYFQNLKNKFKKKHTLEILKEQNPIPIEETCKICTENKVCPFEMQCELAKEAQIIIADYYHILAPSIRETLFQKTEKELPQSIIIFDEAHNIPNKTRDLFTHTLSTFLIDRSKKEAKNFFFEDLEPEIENLNITLNNLSKKLELNKTERIIKKSEFSSQIKDYEELTTQLELAADEIREEKKKSYLSSLSSFLEAWLGQDTGFARILTRDFTRDGKPFLALTYRCLDPSIATLPLIQQAHSLILMSGTLAPVELYEDLLGFKDAETLELDNPFPKENRLNFIIPTISTKYTQRSKEMYEKIAKHCANIVNLIPGNSAIFFPSYSLRDEINYYFQTLCNKTTFLEDSNLNKKEKQELIEKFKTYKNTGAVLLGVSSGSYAEGIDLPGDLLKGVIVVGIPLAKPNLETQELIAYYDHKYQKGWDYGYIYPAIITTLQNAGRCIRSKDDRGVIAFMDERYSWRNYQKCFPKDLHFTTTALPEDKVKEFFKT